MRLPSRSPAEHVLPLRDPSVPTQNHLKGLHSTDSIRPRRLSPLIPLSPEPWNSAQHSANRLSNTLGGGHRTGLDRSQQFKQPSLYPLPCEMRCPSDWIDVYRFER
jgi:hypothetical protein